MKNNIIKFVKYGLGIFLLVGLVLPLVSGVSYAEVFSILGMGGSLAFAAGAGAVSGDTVTREVTDAKSDELLAQAISDKITELKPSATPVDTILRELVKNELSISPTIKSWEYKYYSVDSRGFTDAVDTEVAAATANRAEGYTFEVIVGAVHIWNVDDVCAFVGVDGASGTGEFVGHVTSINTSTNTLTMIAVNGTGTNGADNPLIAAATVMIWLGNAKHELDAQTDPYHIFPQPEVNFAQRFMAQVEESLFMFDADKEVKWNINDHRIQAMYAYRMGQELATLFGAKGYKKIGNDYYHHMNGITKLVTGTTTYTDASMAKADLYKWSKAIFSGNSGSEKRYVFGGGDWMQQFSALEPVEKQMNASNTEVVYGITFNKIITNFGILMVMHHDLFNSIGWGKKALVLDLANIERVTRKNMETRKLELVKSGQRYANAYVLDETITVATRYPDTHKIIQPA